MATDPQRLEIPYVRLKDANGKVFEFKTEAVTEEQIAGGERRRMDCVDCHNKVAHPFIATAERAVDRALADGRLDARLPFLRREAVRLLKAEVAYLEQPRRIEQMAQQLGLAPISPEHETTEDALIDVARHAPVAHAPASPTAAANDVTASAEAPEASPDDYPSPEQAVGQTSAEAPR